VFLFAFYASSDFFTLLGTLGVMGTSPAVREAFRTVGLPYTATSISRTDYSNLLAALLPVLSPAPTTLGVVMPPPAPMLSPRSLGPRPATKTGGRTPPTLSPRTPSDDKPGTKAFAQASAADLAEAVRAVSGSLERLGILPRAAEVNDRQTLPSNVAILVAQLGGNQDAEQDVKALVKDDSGKVDLAALIQAVKGAPPPPKGT